MKLHLLSLLFRASDVLCRLTLWSHRRALDLHEALWRACTKENLRTLNNRATKRTRFN